MLEEIELYKSKQADFGFETTLSGRRYLGLIRELKKAGYQVHIFFLWLPTVEMALSRIKDRVLHGGHDVPEADVRRRFDRSNRNFISQYRPLADSWLLYNGAVRPPSLIAFKEAGPLRIMNQSVYQTIYGRYEEID